MSDNATPPKRTCSTTILYLYEYQQVGRHMQLIGSDLLYLWVERAQLSILREQAATQTQFQL